jgi:protein phosphatase-4 regulatory subunit 3
VKDEFYHRHIIQHDLFAPVFEAFRANPVGDNLVSSAIVEICDFIQNQNIKSLLEYIVTRYLASVAGPDGKSLEDVALPYVSTFSTLRKAYEENLNAANNTSISNSSDRIDSGSSTVGNGTTEHSRFFSPTGTLIRNAHLGMSEKALEDQVSVVGVVSVFT